MQEKMQKISPVKQRILSFAASLGCSKREFYSKIGVSRGTLESNTGVTEDVVAKFIATFPDVSLEWLWTGCGEMRSGKQENATKVDEIQESAIIEKLVGTIQLQAEEIGRLKAELAETKKHAERLAALVNTDSTAHVG